MGGEIILCIPAAMSVISVCVILYLSVREARRSDEKPGELPKRARDERWRPSQRLKMRAIKARRPEGSRKSVKKQTGGTK